MACSLIAKHAEKKTEKSITMRTKKRASDMPRRMRKRYAYGRNTIMNLIEKRYL